MVLTLEPIKGFAGKNEAMAKLIAYTDGACSGNPGPMGVGAVLKLDGKIVKEVSEGIGNGTNNVAEYTAAIRALEEALKIGGGGAKDTEVEVRSDSLLLVNQLNGKYRVKQPHLLALKHKVMGLKAKFKAVKFVHVPREENSEADGLGKKAVGL